MQILKEYTEKMKILREYRDFEYDKKLLEFHKSNTGVYKMKGIFQQADVLNQNGRIYSRDILERETKNYQKLIRERRAFGECVDPETEIFTTNGWKYIKDISQKEEIFTLNIETNDLEVELVDKVEKDFDGEMYHVHNQKAVDMMLTPNHHVLAYNRAKNPLDFYAEDFFNQKNLEHLCFRRGGATWKGNDAYIFLIPKTNIEILSDRWAAFFGIWLSEGCVVRKSKEVQITQKKPENIEKIRNLLQKMPFEFIERTRKTGTKDFYIKNIELANYLSQFGKSHEKFIPKEIKNWSPRLLNILIEWLLIGDGRNRKNPKNQLIRELATTSKQLAEDVCELFFKVGNSGKVLTRIPEDRYIENRKILAENSKPLYIAAEHTSQFTYCKDVEIEKVPYKGKVYCVKTQKNRTWMMRRKNRCSWTFNCDHPDSSVVELKNVSHVVTELYMDNDGTVYGELEVLDTPSGKIIKTLVESNCKIGVSSRGIGETEKQGDHEVVINWVCLAYDIVADPSVARAILVKENKILKSEEIRKLFNKSDRIDRVLNDIL